MIRATRMIVIGLAMWHANDPKIAPPEEVSTLVAAAASAERASRFAAANIDRVP